LPQDGLELVRCGPSWVAEVDLVVTSGGREAGVPDGLVETLDGRALSGIWADMQELRGTPFGEGLDPQIRCV
jgi:hypothetical protein